VGRSPNFAQTGLKIGQTLKVGDLRLTIARAIAYEPDRGPQFVNLAPRVMLRAEDLLRSGLITTGSRIAYALLIAGNGSEVERYRGLARFGHAALDKRF
jgi:putative ABC transport system permease protein